MSAQLRIEIVESAAGGARQPGTGPGQATPAKPKPNESGPDPTKTALALMRDLGLGNVSSAVQRLVSITERTREVILAVKGAPVPKGTPVGVIPAGAPVGPSAGTAIGTGGAAAGAGAAGAAGAGGAAAGGATAGSVIAGIAAALGPLGLAVAGLVIVVGASVLAFKALNSLVKSQAEALAQYSPSVSIAGAIGEIREMQAEMRRADAIGPGLAKMYDGLSRIETVFYDMGTSVLKIVVKLYEAFEPFIEFATDVLGLIAASLDFIVDALKIIIDVATANLGDLPGDLKAIDESFKKIGKAILAFIQNDNPIDDFTDPFLRDLSEVYKGLGGKRTPPKPLNDPFRPPPKPKFGA